MAPRIEQIVNELLNAVADGDGFDLISSFAGPLPTIVIAEMLGVDPADGLDFKRWSDDGVMAFDPLISDEMRKHVQASRAELDEYFRHVVANHRVTPTAADLMSSMIAAEVDGVHMTDAGLVTMAELLLAAGNVTTTDLIGNGTLALLRHPEELRKLRSDPSRLNKNAVEEMLRYDSPVTETARIPLDDTEIRGCRGSGESLVEMLAA